MDWMQLGRTQPRNTQDHQGQGEVGRSNPWGPQRGAALPVVGVRLQPPGLGGERFLLSEAPVCDGLLQSPGDMGTHTCTQLSHWLSLLGRLHGDREAECEHLCLCCRPRTHLLVDALGQLWPPDPQAAGWAAGRTGTRRARSGACCPGEAAH